MRTEFELIAESYLQARAESFTRSPTAEFVRNDAAAAVRTALAGAGEGLTVKSSPGQGQWTETPWVAILDPIVTTTPQHGYYVVYLFSSSMNRIVLSLNQGITEYRGTMSVDAAKELIRHSAALICLRTPEYHGLFNEQGINLDSTSSSSRSAFYEAGHAFGITYSLPLPPESKLVRDLLEMVTLYRLLTFRGGFEDRETQESEENAPPIEGLENAQRYRFHRRIERNTKLARAAKKIHGSTCQTCAFDFGAVYGSLGEGYIEAHHLTPLAALPTNGPIRLSAEKDFAVLCANCHRMIHRPGAPRQISEFRSIVQPKGFGIK
jgi:5-methylcytosine-specific restriction protein A